MNSINSNRLRNTPLPLAAGLEAMMDALALKRGRDDPFETLGIRTGFKDLDRLSGGMKPGSLIVIGGRPSMGKTNLAFNIATHVALNEALPVIIFSLELPDVQVAERLVTQTADISTYRLKTGRLEAEDMAAIETALGKLKQAVIFVDEAPDLGVNEICHRATEIKANHERIGLVVIDDFQCIDATDSDRAVMRAMRKLRALAHELDAPVIVLSRLNRKLEKRKDKRPFLSDFVYRGMEQNADQVLFIYRDEYYWPGTTEKGVAEITLALNRGGATGTVKLLFEGDRLKFREFEQSL